MEAAAQMISRAIELESNENYKEALVCYQEGLDLLLKCSKNVIDKADRDSIRDKIKKYMDRAEVIKHLVEKQKEVGDYHEKIDIAAGSKGYNYESVFSKFINDNLKEVVIRDPYIRNPHQLFNLVRFSELLVKKATNINKIHLLTGRDSNSNVQDSGLEELKMSLSNHDIEFSYEFSETLHDREIIFDNGWVIKIGRGLDYFKRPCGRFTIGSCDFDLRQCHQTTIDVYKRK